MEAVEGVMGEMTVEVEEECTSGLLEYIQMDVSENSQT